LSSREDAQIQEIKCIAADKDRVSRLAFRFPKLFLRLQTKSQTSDFPMTLAKWFFEKALIDSKGLAVYHFY